MTDWTAGYVADLGYIFGYYPELNPLRARLAFLNAGLVPPALGCHCELGYGQGMSANVHAAAGASVWHGNDFNPAHAAFAQSLAGASGAQACLSDEAFADFCTRSDLPQFDSIGLHGIWSWISDDNRRIITDFIERKLKVGGVLYISYNTQPGWAAMAPVRDLLLEHKTVMGAPGLGHVANVQGALAFAEKLMATQPLFAQANPHVAYRISKLKQQNAHYLVHEYFNRDWLPMTFSKMAEWLAPTKLSFACSAQYLDHIDALNLTQEQLRFLKEIPDAMLRESVRDFMVNQQFRLDYWVKGPRKLRALEQTQALRAQRVILIRARADVSLNVKSTLGDIALQEAYYAPILDFLADHQPKTFAQIEQSLKVSGHALALVMEACIILTAGGYLAAVQDEALIPQAKKYTDKLNARLLDMARFRDDTNLIASPVTGGGIVVDRCHQLFLLALSQGHKTAAAQAQFVWDVIAPQGQKMTQNGQALDTPEDNLAELSRQATVFAQKHLPILKALHIA